MSATALIGGVASLAGSLATQAGADSRASESYQRQRDLMALQNQYAVDNWARENRYNTPAAQRQRLRDAGMNPDLVYGQGAGSLQAGSIDAPGAPSAPMSPAVDYSKSVNDAVQAAVGIAEAKKAGSETLKNKIEVDYLSETFTERVKEVGLRNNWTRTEMQKVEYECQNIAGNWNLLQEQITQARKQNVLTDKQISYYNRRMEAEIGEIVAKTHLDNEQKRLLSENMQNIVSLTGAQAAQVEAVVGLMNKYGDAQAIVGMLGQLVSSATDLIGLFMPHKAVTNIFQNIKKN